MGLQSVSGISTGDILKLEASASFNNDRSYRIRTFPAYLNDAFLIQTPHKHVAQGSVITITTSDTTTLYVGFEYPGKSGGFEQSLPNAGWTKEEGKVTTDDRTLKEIYSMKVNGPTSISLPGTTTGELVSLISAKCSSTG